VRREMGELRRWGPAAVCYALASKDHIVGVRDESKDRTWVRQPQQHLAYKYLATCSPACFSSKGECKRLHCVRREDSYHSRCSIKYPLYPPILPIPSGSGPSPPFPNRISRIAAPPLVSTLAIALVSAGMATPSKRNIALGDRSAVAVPAVSFVLRALVYLSISPCGGGAIGTYHLAMAVPDAAILREGVIGSREGDEVIVEHWPALAGISERSKESH
jgi:hypothetical protein